MSSRGQQAERSEFSKFHPSRPYTDCSLCSKSEVYYNHFQQLSSHEQAFITRHLGQMLTGDSCMCRAHYFEAQRHCNDHTYIPKWKKIQPARSVITCSQPDCTLTSTTSKIIRVKTTSAIREELQTSADNTTLCQKHYQAMYRKVNAPICCAACGARPKHGSAFTRHSPNAALITSHLRENADFDGDIKDNDCLCLACYAIYPS